MREGNDKLSLALFPLPISTFIFGYNIIDSRIRTIWL